MKTATPARTLPQAALLAVLFLCCLLLFPGRGDAAPATVTEYRVISRAVMIPGGKAALATRSLRRDGVPFLLTVDPDTFETALRPVAQVTMLPAPPAAALAGTPFLKALHQETSPPYRLQNHGITRGGGNSGGFFLTVDLCPSRRPFERELFEAAATLSQGKGAPVAVVITGAWLESHPEDLSYLKEGVAAGRLAITWVNHSYHHPYTLRVPLEQNFLLTPGTDFDAEVLDVERLLLSHGLLPSPFFRFPGLVADAATIKRLRELSLIPLGSEAWLAKGEQPRQGSIVLVHGNGNEPKGISLALPLLRSGKWRLLPLAAAFER